LNDPARSSGSPPIPETTIRAFAAHESLVQHLVARVRLHDVEAFGELYDRYRVLVYSVARRITKDGRMAEEVLQDTFLKLWQAADTYDPLRGSFETWILTIARHLSLNVIRRRSLPATDEGELDDMPWVGADPSEEALIKLRREAVSRVVRLLPATQRQVVQMAYFEGLTLTQIAVKTSSPLGTVKSRLRLALAKLRNLATKEGLENAG
jgi:RNA polymerase sigma-70 factor (ECF subfamily)